MKQETEDVIFVQDNYTLMCDYLYNKFPDSIEDREFMQTKLEDWQNAKSSRTILEDYRKTNDEKYNYFLKKFDDTSLIVSVIADRGEGKTAFCIKLLEDLAKRGHSIYPLYPFPQLPFMKKQVYDLSEIPVMQNGKRTLAYVDELAKKYKARDSMSSDSIAMTDELIELRHFDGSIVGGTQDPRLVDINYFTLSDIKVWKSYNIENEALTREGVLTDMVKQLMPKSGQIQNVLVVHKGEYSTFKFDFSPYSQDTSKYLKTLKTPENRQKIIEYVSKYHKNTELKKILHTQFSIRLTIEEQKEIVI